LREKIVFYIKNSQEDKIEIQKGIKEIGSKLQLDAQSDTAFQFNDILVSKQVNIH